jgi:hypothetical protein
MIRSLAGIAPRSFAGAVEHLWSRPTNSESDKWNPVLSCEAILQIN